MTANNDGREGRPLWRPTNLRRWAGYAAQRSRLPFQDVQLTLIWPILRAVDQTRTHWILQDILPFLLIALAPAELCVPEMTLPDRRIIHLRPMSRGVGFPEVHPFA